ncbi:unnamed protein product [Ranitomeya imitator]|uniref:Uncharacterized protein n=1 Tax=Ranitomeya imitator TaxID=111125 RepID=A0ABN9KWW7_9NEOB|nr:unnamed protein product [Ranitomeya imitator]
MTVESAKHSVLGSLYSQDRILQAMGNITLAFHLLCERANPNSFWLPYIKTLPSEYDTPLYFQEEEVQQLLSTQAIHDVFSQYKNTARQYAYFYKVIQICISDRCPHISSVVRQIRRKLFVQRPETTDKVTFCVRRKI